MKKRPRTSTERVFRIRAALACALGIALVFSAVMIFTYDLWTVAVTASILFLATAGAVVAWSAGRIPVTNSWLLAAVLFPAAWGVFQVFSGKTIYRFGTWLSVLQYFEAACCFWLALQVGQSVRARCRFSLALAVFACLFAVLAMMQLFGDPSMLYFSIPLGPGDQDGMGPFQNHDHYAAFMELLLPITAWEALRGRKAAPLFGAMTIVIFASIIATVSRAGSITAVLELMVLLLIAVVRRQRMSVPRVAVAAIGLLVVALLVGSAAGLDLLLSRFQTGDQFQSRREYFQSSVAMARTRPLYGYGLGTWPLVYPRFARFDTGKFANHAHNDWAEWACEGGIPLVLAFLVIAGRSAWLAWKLPAALGIFAVFLHNAVDFNMREHPIPLLMLALLGWAEGSVRATEAELNANPRARDRSRRHHSIPASQEEFAAQNAAASDAAGASPLS